MVTNAHRVIEMLQAAGVERLFGMPGGGSNADLIEAAADLGLPFTLAHTEAASAFMAGAQAEITGKPGACLATLGPGAASIVNGVAHAHLDRVPLFVLTDCLDEASSAAMQHQALCHGRIFSSVVKWSARPDARNLCATLQRALAEVSSLPHGPVHLDLSSALTGATAGCDRGPGATPAASAAPADLPDLPHDAQRPVFLIGLGARTTAIRQLCERFHIPALVTYKAKGVVADDHPWFGGVFTHGTLERNLLDRADLLLAIGLDPVELLPRPWTYRQPVIALTEWAMAQQHVPVVQEVVAPLAGSLEALAERLSISQWTCEEVQSLAGEQRRRMRPAGRPGDLLPHRVVELVAEMYRGSRATVDAGAHMFPVMSHWPGEEPRGVLISNGLATMGFGLPAGIGAALLDRSRPTIVFTGDGGLLMCLAELRTAARERLPLRIIVFDDGELSLIKIKQVQRGYRTAGTSLAGVDWPAVAGGFGVEARLATDEEALASALRETAGCPGPVLIAARIAADTYRETMHALRG